MTRVRWALGQPPTSDDLLKLEYYDPLLALCEWNIEDYEDILPVLRDRPLTHCTALAVLGDASTAERVGQGMLQCVREWKSDARQIDRGSTGFFRGQKAVEHLRSPNAVEPLYEAIELIPSNFYYDLALTIGKIEDTNRLDRLIRLIQRSDDIVGDNPRRPRTLKSKAALALLITLGRKP
jgi:hypothetical protein